MSRISNMLVLRTVQEALGEPSWRLAVMEEINALKRNNTWTVIDLPKDKKTVGCKWVFTVKFNADGSVERYKTRLVAKGFTQTHDDIIMTGDDSLEISNLKRKLEAEFDIKDLGKLKYFISSS
ncbi:uncharacterized protein LOC110022585 [Phalaenopsis equestris]|uniref:uncharacterized protein LOC110022585 n=1 Tax=Phalaenopsis equestris TaxID=78828 RepID=UPI0009E54BD3|nr:uncharacterized protein LOC110022585 [Phalaenopsis equestris]